jgi:uncharacterized membrane protein YfcA
LDIVIFIVVGLLAGVLSGFFGIGGGIIIVPALIYIAGFSQLKAQGTSLAVLLPPVGIMAFLEYYKKGNVDLKAGLIICAMVVLGSAFGGHYAQKLSPDLLKKCFAVFLMLVSVKMLSGK